MTKLFHHENRQKSARSRHVYAMFEIAYTIIDFLAAFLFFVGSVLFFWSSTENTAIWCFVVGSVFFMVKPTLRTVRELRLAAMGDDEDLAEKLGR